MGRWALWSSTTFENLPLSTCSLCQQKSHISKSIQPIFEIFASVRRCWEWAFGWKVLGAQVFYFCSGKVKTLRIDNIWNFADFNLYTVPAKIPYLEKYSTDFRNLCLGSKMFRVVIRVESLRCGGILLLLWQGENFAHRQNLKFCHFQLVDCASKNPISPKEFNRFSKSLPELEGVEGEHLGAKVQVRRPFFFCNGKVKTVRIEKIWNSPAFNLYTVHCGCKSPISPKVFNRFWKSLPQLEDVEGGHSAGKF